MELPTGTVTFLFTDIEGSTRLWEELPEEMRRALARHDMLLRGAIEAAGGVVFKAMGDGFCAAFATAGEAVAAALAAQRIIQQVEVPAIPLRVRAGLHTGPAEPREGDYFGQAVNRAARLSKCGHGGQILLSHATEELARDSLTDGCSLRDLGEHRLPDLGRPERIFQLLCPDLPADFPPLLTLDYLPNNLPIRASSFVGRTVELDEVKGLLTCARLLTVTGAGGCGKTRLALQAAAEMLQAFPDGAWLVELAALSYGASVPQAVAGALGLRERPGRSITEPLTGYLRGKSLLLLLDNCEHLVEACARLTDGLLRSCPGVRILATSQAVLNVEGEIVWRVPSLSRPDAERFLINEEDFASTLMGYDAVRLFVERAQSLRADFKLTRKNGQAVAQLCRRLDGIPLALELAAARVPALGVEQIVRRLDQRFDLLTGGWRTAPSRQQTLRGALEWSYDLLTENERLLLARLSVFAGGWTLEAAEAVCACDPVKSRDVPDLLAALVQKSLVVFADHEGAEGRYEMLETIRQYGLERLAQLDARTLARSAHQNYFLRLAEEAEPELTGPDQMQWLERLGREHDNLREALRFSLDTTPDEPGTGARERVALRLSAALHRFWFLRGYFSEGRDWLVSALAQPGAAEPTPARANAVLRLGDILTELGDYVAGQAYLEESLAVYRETGDRRGVAASLDALANALTYQGECAAARTYYEESLSISRKIGDQLGIMHVINNLGYTALNEGEYAMARRYLEECLTICRRAGERGTLAVALHNLGNVARAEGRFAEARTYLEESLSISGEVGNRFLACWALEGFAPLALALGQTKRAACLGGAAERLREEIGACVPPVERPRHEQWLAAARSSMADDVAFDAAWQQGREMTMGQAAEYALSDEPEAPGP